MLFYISTYLTCNNKFILFYKYTWASASFIKAQLGTLQALSSTRCGLVLPLELAYSSSRSHWLSSLEHRIQWSSHSLYSGKTLMDAGPELCSCRALFMHCNIFTMVSYFLHWTLKKFFQLNPDNNCQQIVRQLGKWKGQWLIHNIVFQGMYVLPAKHSYAWLPRKCDYWTDRHSDRRTDPGQSDPYVTYIVHIIVCAAMLCRWHNKSCQKTMTLAGRQPSLNRTQG